MNIPYIDHPAPPICLHALGQPLINKLWQEAQELKDRLQTVTNDYKKLQEQYDALKAHCIDLNEKINLINDINNL